MMFKPFRQTVWGARVAIDLFFGGVGGGIFVAYAIFSTLNPSIYHVVNSVSALSAIFVILGLLVLTSEVGRPMNSMKVINNLKTSWMSRGALISIAFVLVSGLLFILNLAGITWLNAFLIGLNLIIGLILIAYPGLLLRAVLDIPAWRSLTIFSTMYIYSFLSGVALLDMYLLLDGDGLAYIGTVTPSIAIVVVILSAVSLYNLRRGKDAASVTSYRELTETGANRIFWLGAMVLGLVAPASIFLYVIIFNKLEILDLLATLLILIGALSFKYSILRVGFHKPMIKSATHQ
ncbi:MAG: polysulfide reductase NrfD [Nitrososphaerota archaeon]|nr:polysulfide reductase NrfD [Nitrososphaerota archaeon]MDG7039507.1 polysulfide reductase NrfD [Nitrososphaerota archaeon]